MRDYTKIEAWQFADDFAVSVYQTTKAFPREELYGLTSQLRRAAYSSAANIVEGATRESKREYLHFLYIARGSLSEAGYFVHLAHRLGYLTEVDTKLLRDQCNRALACLHGLTRAVEKEAGGPGRLAAIMISFIASWISTRLAAPLVA